MTAPPKRMIRTGIQYGALPYRIEGRQLQVLLITSRGTRRWVIPKGWPIKGLRPAEAAALEAAEEAGVAGDVDAAPIGSYQYVKRFTRKRTASIQVIVFPLRVRAPAPAWKEEGQRSLHWFAYRKAAVLVAEPGLRRLIRELGAAETPGLLARGLRVYRSWRLDLRGSAIT